MSEQFKTIPGGEGKCRERIEVDGIVTHRVRKRVRRRGERGKEKEESGLERKVERRKEIEEIERKRDRER